MTSDRDPLADGASASDALSRAVRERLVTFVRELRREGAEVPASGGIAAAEALAVVGLQQRERARAALRAALLSRVEDDETFDPLFERFWRGLDGDIAADDGPSLADELDEDDGGLEPTGTDPGGEGDDRESAEPEDGFDGSAHRFVGTEAAASESDEFETAQYSPGGTSEAIRIPSERESDADVGAAVGRLTQELSALPGRRTRPVSSGRRPDMRKALRESVGTGGVLTSVPEQGPKTTEVSGVVFADVSRSVLDVIDRDFLVAFLRAVTKSWRRSRVFLFDDEMADVTAAFRADSMAAAYRSLVRAEASWGGGTRIGHAIASVRASDPDAIDRRTDVLVISDGLEMGEVEELEASVAWLARRASNLFWLNPLAKSSEYEPVAAGMAAALPYLDGFFPFTGPDDVFEMARRLRQYGGSGTLGTPR